MVMDLDALTVTLFRSTVPFRVQDVHLGDLVFDVGTQDKPIRRSK